MSIIEASHFSAGTAYVAANRYQMDDMRPYIYKTTDYGATWKLITSGIARTSSCGWRARILESGTSVCRHRTRSVGELR